MQVQGQGSAVALGASSSGCCTAHAGSVMAQIKRPPLKWLCWSGGQGSQLLTWHTCQRCGRSCCGRRAPPPPPTEQGLTAVDCVLLWHDSDDQQ